MNQEFGLRGAVIANGAEITDGLVVIEGSTIRFAGEAREFSGELPESIIQVDGWICSGFMDIHMHGIDAHDTMDGTPESLQAISKALTRFGVTSFLATTMTAPYEQIEPVLASIAQSSRLGLDGAEVVGIHLEGPWIRRCVWCWLVRH